MYKSQEEEGILEIFFNSVYSNIEKAIPDLDSFLRKYFSDDLSNIHLVFREICNNAIEHGNKEEEEELVNIKVKKLTSCSFELSVTDSGEGFDHSKLNYAISDETLQERSRGFALINSLSEKIEFNEKGNKISVQFLLLKKTTFKVSEKGKEVTITPNGNLVGEIKKEFLGIINPLYSKGPEKVILDLEKVNEVDSIGLSILFIFGKSLREKNAGCSVMIENANMRLIDLFFKTGLQKIINIV